MECLGDMGATGATGPEMRSGGKAYLGFGAEQVVQGIAPPAMATLEPAPRGDFFEVISSQV